MRIRRTTAAAATALPLLALACSQRTDSARRADSATTASTPAASSLDTGRAAAPAAPPPAASSSPGASATATPGSDSTPRRKQTKSTRPTGTADSRDSSTAAGGQASDSGKGPHGHAAAPASPAGGAASSAGASGGTKVNEFMSYDAASKTTDLKVVAAYDHTLGGFNYNGGARGSHVITVPQGWTVRMDVKNVDAIPHSAIVIKQQQPLPNAPETPDISRAYSSHVNDGLPPVNGEDLVTFRASPAGSYWIYCGVPGHGPSGMYISLIVTPEATAPTYKMP